MDVLPNDLVRKCLLGVPYKSHDDLKAVCRDWEAIVSNPKFYADRKISGTSEQLICLIRMDRKVEENNYVSRVYAIRVYDPVKGTWETLSPIDDPECLGIPIWCECVAVNRKLVLIGGMHPHSKITMKSVYIYDFVSARWSRGADMPTPRYAFASSFSSSTGLIYVAGGANENISPSMAAAEAYNVEENKWEILPPMIESPSFECRGVFMEGKFVVISDPYYGFSPEVFDPSAGTWRRWQDLWIGLSQNLWGSCKVATSSRNLYVFIKQDIMKYDAKKNLWTAVGTLPRDIHVGQLLRPRVTEWRDWLFVTGFGLSNERIYYLFNLSTGRSIEVNSDHGEDITLSAATVEI